LFKRIFKGHLTIKVGKIKMQSEWDLKRVSLIKEFGKTIIKLGALKFGPHTLTSGKISSYYIDLRMIPSFPDIFKMTTDIFVEIIKNNIGLKEVDAIGGVPTAGLIFASSIAYDIRKPLVYVRKDVRKHGTLKKIEGVMRPGCKVLIIDDLITTGSSIVDAAEAVRSQGGLVNNAIVLVDRMEGGERNLKTVGIDLKTLTKITELTDFLYDMTLIDNDQRNAIHSMINGNSRS
jgi:orotate phosphoribosyltransferase